MYEKTTTSTSHEYTRTLPTLLFLPSWPSLSKTSSLSKQVSNGSNLSVSRFSRTPTRQIIISIKPHTTQLNDSHERSVLLFVASSSVTSVASSD